MPSPYIMQYEVEILPSHIDWGVYRYTATRPAIPGEGYVKIPKTIATRHNILRGRKFTAVFDDYPSFPIKACGNANNGEPIFAKQFEGDGDLKAFGRWYHNCNAKVGDIVIVTMLDEDTILFQLSKG